MRGLVAAMVLVCGGLLLGGCNAGPLAAFGGSAALTDVQFDQPYRADGRRARMEVRVRWNFVRVGSGAFWR